MASQVLAKLENLLLKEPFNVTAALCTVFDDSASVDPTTGMGADDLVQVITSFYSEHMPEMISLLRRLMHIEVQDTIDECTLFRRNCVITKLLTVFARKVGQQYIEQLLKPLLFQVKSLKLDEYELDKNRLTQSEYNLETNANNLISLCRSFIQRVLDSEPEFPPLLRILCNELHTEVKNRFPSSEYSCVGGFIFLRYLCPALVTPEQFGIVPDGSIGKNRRVLVLISKILQNIANKIVSSDKEPYMQAMNTFVREYTPIIMNFFASLCKINVADIPKCNFIVEMSASDALDRLCAYLKVNIHKLGVVLISGHASKKKNKIQKSEKRGFLHKYGENIVTDAWRKRWFILRNGQLLYFKSIQDSHAAGIIPLADIKIGTINSDECIFELETPYRSYWLKASTYAESVEWVECIRASIAPQNDFEDSSDEADFLPLERPVPVEQTGSEPHTWVKSITKPRTNSTPITPTRPLLNTQRSASPTFFTQSANQKDSKPSLLARCDSADTVRMSRGSPRGSPVIPLRGNVRSPAPVRTSRGGGSPRLEFPTDKAPTPPTSSNSSPLASESSERSAQPDERINAAKRDTVALNPVNRGAPRGAPRARGGSSRGPAPIRGQPVLRTHQSVQLQPQDREKKAVHLSTSSIERNPPNSESKWGGVKPQAMSEDKRKSFLQKPPPKTEFSGQLQRRNFSTQSWVTWSFTIRDMHLIQSKLNGDLEEMIPLIGVGFYPNSPTSFEIRRGASKLLLQAPDQATRDEWLKNLHEGQIDKQNCILASVLEVFSTTNVGINSEQVWVELRPEALVLCDITHDNVKPRSSYRIAEAVIRKLSETSYEISDESSSVTLSWISVETSGVWINQIKRAKLNFWKGQQANPTRVVSRSKDTSTLPNIVEKPAIPSSVALAFRPMSKTISMIIEGPPAATASQSAVHEGYLFRLERDRKTWNRYYAILSPPILWLYKSDSDVLPCGKIDVSGSEITSACLDGEDDFQFFVNTKQIGSQFDAADPLDFQSWMTNLKKVANPNLLDFNVDLPSHRGHLIVKLHNTNTLEKSFWFTISKQSTLEWYTNETEKTPTGSISLDYARFNPLVDGTSFEILNPKNPPQKLLLVATSEVSRGEWIQKLHLAKFQYWKSNPGIPCPTPGFFNRGYLMKYESKKWVRRWCIVHHELLLFYKNPKEPVPLGEILLDRASIGVSNKENEFQFDIISGDKSAQFEANNLNNLSTWLDVLNSARKNPIDKSLIADTGDDYTLDNPDHEGFLMKQGVTRKSWKRRWFVLKYPMLYYFESSQISPGEHAGMISLHNADVIIRFQDSTLKNKQAQFQIETRQRIFFLRADTEEDVSSWVDAIQRFALKIAHTGSLDNALSPRRNQPSASADKTGYLIKKGRTNKVWKRRYFSLSQKLLSYKASQEESEEIGVISLEGCSVSIADESLKRKYCFVVSTRYRNYFLQASDQYDMACWIESIKYACQSTDTSLTASVSVALFNTLNELLAAHDKLSK